MVAVKHRKVKGRHRAAESSSAKYKLVAIAAVAVATSTGSAVASPMAIHHTKAAPERMSAWVAPVHVHSTASRTTQVVVKPAAPKTDGWNWDEFAAVAKQFEDESGYTAKHHH